MKSTCNLSVRSCLSPWPISVRRIYPVFWCNKGYLHAITDLLFQWRFIHCTIVSPCILPLWVTYSTKMWENHKKVSIKLSQLLLHPANIWYIHMSTIVSMSAVTNAVSWNIGRKCLMVQNFDECCCLTVKQALVIFLLLLYVLVAVITTPRHIVHTYFVMTIFSFTLSTAVHGYYAYPNNWKPDIRDELYCEREPKNSHEPMTPLP